MVARPPRPPLAIVGLSALFPGSHDVGGFWKDILEGTDRISDVPPTHWLVEDYYSPDPSAPDKTYARRGAFLSAIDFDPMEHGVPPTILPATDTSQLLSLILAKKVLEDASQGQFSRVDPSRASIILGVTSAQELVNQMASRMQRPIWVKALREQGLPEDEVQAICERISSNYVPWQESSFPGLLGNVVAGRIANRLNLGGTNCVTDAACASSLSALSMGMNELYLGDSDLAIIGGVDTMNDIFMFMCFSKTPALSLSGDCRPFSAKADGTMLGEGLGFVAIKRLDDAERDGDRVYAVIRGLGSSSDGRAASVYAPVPQGQAKALRRTYEVSGYGPDTVELVEAHGTGTKAGDAAEFEGLRQAFSETSRTDLQWCALGSVKSQIGHTKSAAGAAGLIKTVLALHHKVLPPTIKVDEPNPAMKIDESPFYLNTEARPWVRAGDHPRRASISSFGFGGSNFHVALEEYTGPGPRAARLRAMPTELFVLAAATPGELVAAARKLATTVSEGDFWAHARDNQGAYVAGPPARLALIAADAADLKKKLDQAIAAIESKPDAALSTPTGIHYALGAEPGKVAFVFPGQGSQYLGMGGQLAMAFDEALAVWDTHGTAALEPGVALHGVVYPRPVFSEEARATQQAKLTSTEWAQPGIGAVSASMLAVLRQAGLAPDMTGGHSFGEVTALHAAGVFDEAALIAVARQRGTLMASAATEPGAMLAVVCTLDELRSQLNGLSRELVVANHNSPKQVVLSGKKTAIVEMQKKLEARGLTARLLPVSTAFHSPLVSASSEPFQAFLEGVPFADARLPVYSNAEAAPYPAAAGEARALLASQIARPVRFVEQIEAMHQAGARTFVEVGPGSVLTQLVGECLAGKTHAAISLDRKGQHGVTSLWNALGRLVVQGLALDLKALWSAYDRPATPPKKGMVVPISGSNYGKPYPPKGGAAALPPPNPPRSAPRKTEAAPSLVAPAMTVHTPAAPAPVPVAPPVAAPVAAQPAPQAPAATLVQAAPAQIVPRRGESVYTYPVNLPAAPSLASAFQEVQRQTADAHAAYLYSVSDAHSAFLRTAEASIGALGQLLGAPAIFAPAPAAQPAHALPTHAPAPRALAPAPQVIAAPPAAPVVAAPPAHAPPPAAFVPAPQAVAAPPAAPVASRPAAPAVAAAPVALAAPVAPVAAPAVDLKALLLQVVADKTGYPTDMLSMDMALEADLGIDSIKRVEILSAMQEKAPGLPAVQARDMAALKTLGQIVAKLEGDRPAVAAAPVAAPPAAAPVAAAAPAVDLKALLLQVVADKTGYPTDMLSMDMALEADLGIDSIKRVEILSAMQEKAPGLPAVQARDMAALKTLGQIVAKLEGDRPAAPIAAPPVAAPAAPAVAAAPAAHGLDLKALLLQVVADKTGYPTDMLSMDMALEADLGIDSIKRVEILSAMQEKAPGLPAVQARDMAALKTLGQIVAKLEGGEKPAPAAAVVAEGSLGKAVDLKRAGAARFEVIVSEAPGVGLGAAGLLTAAKVLVTSDGSGVAEALVEKLREAGLTAEVVAAAPEGAEALIFLGGLRDVRSVAEAIEVNREAFRAARACAGTLSTRGGLLVTVQDTGGDLGFSGASGVRAWMGGLTGLAKSAAAEWPRATVRAVDLERGGRPAAEVAAQLLRELLTGGEEPEVGLSAAGRRVVPRSQAAAPPAGALAVDASSVIVATGGARGVTAACLVALAQAARPRIALIGRTPLADEPASLRGLDEAALGKAILAEARAAGRALTPATLRGEVQRLVAAREVRGTLAALAAAGSEAIYLSADAQDAASLTAAFAEVRRRLGPITGVVHGAGVLADKLIVEKTEDQVERVLATKVGGLQALLDATAGDPIRTLCLFSSVAARAGNAGQSDYAMANEILNKVAAAEAKRRPGCVVSSLNWGPWEGGMVTPALAAHFKSRGVPLIAIDAGAQSMVDEHRTGSASIEVVLGGSPDGEGLQRGGLQERRHGVLVNRATYPMLDSHRVQGPVVVPAVAALDWFVRAASLAGLGPVEVRDLRVLKGIRVEHFDGAGLRLVVVARPAGEGLDLELRGVDGSIHYSARAQRAEGPIGPGISAPEGLSPWGVEAASTYNGALFHGPLFQALRSLDGFSAQGATATMKGSRELGWPEAPYGLDPALLDGGLQLARLWALQKLGRPSLPTKIGSYRGAAGLVTGPIRCLLRSRSVGDYRTVSDIAFLDAAGALVAELREVDMHTMASAEPVKLAPATPGE